MATYAVGDVQGCFDTLQARLQRLDFDPTRDRLWIAGDLVNRGPKNADVLRWAMQNEHCVTAVLGNHDVHLLARALADAPAKRKDTIDDVLEADDRDTLIEWLRRRPAAHRDGDFVMLHAGLLPEWSAHDAVALSELVAASLARDDALIARMADRRAVDWSDDLTGLDRAEAALRVLCNLRTLDPAGRPAFDYAGPPDEAPDDRIPWFDFPGRTPFGATVVCGHWAAQGLHLRDDMIALDTGAVWGNQLTAIDLATREVTAVALQDDLG